MSVLFPILLLGGLILLHETGHFLMARLMGIHVETFSIGFGPKLMGFQGKQRGELPPTEYIIAPIPIGGYVKMLGQDPAEDVPEAVRRVSFQGAPAWRRFLVMAAGPVSNLLLPFVIFFFFFLGHDTVAPALAGTIVQDGPAYAAGLRPGDRIVSLDGEPVHAFWDFRELVRARPEQTVSVRWVRKGQEMSGEISIRGVTRVVNPKLRMTEYVGEVGLMPTYLEPIVDPAPGSLAARAGLHTWDRVVAVNGAPVKRLDAVLSALADHAQEPVALGVLRYEPEAIAGSPVRFELARGEQVTLPAAGEGPADRGLRSAEMVLRRVIAGSPADRAGLKPGDRIERVDGHAFPSWVFLRAKMSQMPRGHTFEIASSRDGVAQPPVEVTFEEVLAPAELQPDRKVTVFGAQALSALGEPEAIPNDDLVGYAAHQCVAQTLETIEMNARAVGGLFTGSTPLTDLGGPILITQLAARASDQGWAYFFRLMAWLSISLGLINLLPVPVLDGGQLLFLGIEAVRRKPVSLRTRQIAVYAGVAFVLVMLVLVFKNDLERMLF